MVIKGDAERQAILGSRTIKRKDKKTSVHVPKNGPHSESRCEALGYCCGTGHILQELATKFRSTFFVDLDVSPAMRGFALCNVAEAPNAMLVESDGLNLFFNLCFLCCDKQSAEYSPKEAYRVLRQGEIFFEYESGPEANKEIRDLQIGSIREFPLLWRLFRTGRMKFVKT